MKFKKLLFVIAVSGAIGTTPNYSFAQKKEKTEQAPLTLPMKDNTIFYEEISTASGTKEEIFIKARKWFVDNFKDAKSVLQIEDRQDGVLTGKALYRYDFNSGVNTSEVSLYFTLNVDIKDGKYRIQFYDMNGFNNKTNGLLAGLTAASGTYDPDAGKSTIDLDYTKSYQDYLNGKKLKYNKRLLEGMNEQALYLLKSFNEAVNVQKEDF